MSFLPHFAHPDWLLLPLLGMALFPLASAAQDADAEIDIPYTKFVLDNGLTLIVHEDHKAPIVSVNVWYHVGSKNEKPGKTGFAHLFEHLMFNGSEHFNDDYFQALEKVGATDLNGTTNTDRTNYFQNVPTPALDLVLWMESDRMGYMNKAIDQAKLDEQRGVVQNEKRQGDNQPYAIASDLITKNTYPAGHPYSWTVIGEMEDLDAASLEDVHEWFDTYYGAANATLVIAGDIDPQTAKEKVEKYFGHIPAGPAIARQESWIAKRTGEHRQVAQDRVPQARLYKVWNTPGYGTKDAVMLDLITDVLSAGKSTRLYKRLVYDDQIATSARASIYGREIAGQVTITATAAPGADLAQLEKAIDEELARFLEEGPTAEELERFKVQHRASFIRGIERIGGFGGKSDRLAQNQVFMGDPEHYKTQLRWAEEATPEELREVARKWLSDGAYVLEIHPLPETKSAPTDVDRSKLPEVTGFPKLDLPSLQRTTLSNGLEVVLAERHEIPTVELTLMVNAGFAADQFSAPGVASMAMSMQDEGAGKRSALEIGDDLDLLGANLSTGAGMDNCSVRLSALTSKLDESLDIFADVVLHPTFPENELERLKRQRLAGIQQEKTNPFATAYRLLPALIYGKDHAYGQPLTGTGTEESTKALTREDLVRFHDTWFQPGNATVIVVGDTTLAEIKPLLEKHLGGWKKTADVPKKNIAQVDPPAKRVVYVVDKPGAQQSVIIAGLPTVPKDNPEEVAIETLNAILGGTFTSRLNMNLREDKHWSYGVRTMVFDTKGPRPFLAVAPVQTDKTKESLQEMDKEMREILGDKPPTADELAKAQDNLTLRLPGRFETKRALIGAIQEMITYGLPEDYYETYPQHVRALDVDQVAKAAKEIVMPDHLVWIVVGDRSKIAAGIDELGWGQVHLLSPDGDILN
ncbi:MAG: pitrilysin family protein [Bryobacterales bacterium]